MLAFYPADWSPVCGDQMALYNEMIAQFRALRAQLLAFIGQSLRGGQLAVGLSGRTHGIQTNLVLSGFGLLIARFDFQPKRAAGFSHRRKRFRTLFAGGRIHFAQLLCVRGKERHHDINATLFN